jgi:amidase
VRRSKETKSSKFSRRQFLGSGAQLGAATLAFPALAWKDAPAATPPIKSFELEEATITELQDGMKSGKFTARSLTEKYLARIQEIDRSGPRVNSVIEINPDALAIAGALDAEQKSKGPRGPMHGIPVLIKDNIGTADRMMTTAGSLALSGFAPSRDAFIAQRLRESGAVLLGKTNLSEWANIRSGHSSSGWSGRGGQTRNPYALDRNPCGSSSGSGAAASSSLCAAAVGTETDGSIVCPSSANGLVGIKPTLGLLSRSGIIPIAHSQDTPGPMARTVTDATILLGALAGVDPADPATAASQGHASADYTQFLDPKGLRGSRIGVVRKLFGSYESIDALMTAALDAMKREGAVLVDPVEIETLGKFDDSEFQVLLYELKTDLNAYLQQWPNAPVKSLKEVIEFNDRNRQKEMPYFGQDIFLKAEEKGPLTTKEYLDALEKNRRLAGPAGIDAVMDKNHLDALVAPTGGVPWLIDLVAGDHDTGGSSSPAAVAGYPDVTVPAGFIFGLPVGISFFGRAWSEPTLLKLAFAFEQATRFRRPPRFLPTAELTPSASR